MNTIFLKRLRISNFMGCREFDHEFSGETTISGDNGTGKSTIYDAFLWLLFGKNHRDEKDFYIKNTVDKSLNRQDHVVEGTLVVGGEEIILCRTYREKWQKQRGNETPEFVGHETDFTINDVPLKATEYKQRIDAIISEDVFKLITNVYAFNEMDWQSMRKILEKIAGVKTDEEIAAGNEDFQKLLRALYGKNFDDYRKQLNARKKDVKDKLEDIPVQISEASRSKQDVAIFQDESRLEQIKKEIANLQAKKDDISKKNKEVFEQINKDQQALSDLKHKLIQAKATRESSAKSGIIKAEETLRAATLAYDQHLKILGSATEEVADVAKNIEEIEGKLAQLRADYVSTNEERPPIVDQSDCNCPTCKQRLPDDVLNNKQETLETNWNLDKIDKLNKINEKGAKLKQQKADAEKQLIGAKQAEAEADKKLADLESSKQTAYHDLEAEKQKPSTDRESEEEMQIGRQIESFVVTPSPKVDFSVLDAEIERLQKENDSCVAATTLAANNKKIDARIVELKTKEQELNKELASIEKTEFVMAEFTKVKMEQIEKSINSMFKYTTFQMFETQINGGEKEVCIPKYGNVPYSGVNTAGRINMGVDIINVLTKHYETMAPVFVDNTESINKIIDTHCQLIKLQVSNDAKLTIINQNKSINYV